MKLSPQYQPQEHESDIYRQWEESGAFAADSASSKDAYTISMPPPNATGELHIGHALFLTIQDILVRAARMQGKEALWLPGTDHAAIATESVVIKNLQAQGMANPRQELGREKLVQEIADYVEQSRGTIRSQIRQMGSSCDWSRERYTLEPALNRIVGEVFKKMYDDGLIYRGHRIVNWDPALRTTVSDDEVERREETAPFYTFKYGPFEIGTARPETKFGDKYVVMHPDDKRYQEYNHGDTFEAEWINGPVTATVIKDEAVDPEFGTGVMTITPWHDAVDFDIAQRHELDKEQIIDFEGNVLPIAEEFAGQPIAMARPKIVAKLKDKGLLVSTDENYQHNVAVNSRGKGIIEPQIKLQWFIDVNKKGVDWKGGKRSLKEVMQDVVRSGDITIYPKRFEKIYFHWIDNLRDWCISRQIWWGHRIPAWYKGDDLHIGAAPPDNSGWTQDPDTLDTWFSTGLWTWSTLIDAKLAEEEAISIDQMLEQSPDYQKFHPTTVMETGHDILFFWVARMILMTTYVTGQIPFRDVFLHGLVSGRRGKKMSKSDPDSMIDPLDMIEEYGADALRFGLVYQMSYDSQVISFDEDAVKTARNFANKIWNVARYLESAPDTDERGFADNWIQSRFQQTATRVTTLLQQYRVGEAAHLVHEFAWSDFADWYLEILKVQGSTEHARQVFDDTLKLLHPFMPHVTELLWQHNHGDLLMISPWPKTATADRRDSEASAQMKQLQDIVTTIRSTRRLLDIPPAQTVQVHVEAPDQLHSVIAKLARAKITGPANNMKQFPLPSGGTVAIAGDAVTADSINKAKVKLDDQEQELRSFIVDQTDNINQMKGKAPPSVIRAKKKLIGEARSQLSDVQQSQKLLAQS